MNAKLTQLLLVLCCTLYCTTTSMAQTCLNAENFDESPFGVLPPPSAPGYFAAYGTPQITDQNCPVGVTGRGVQIKASEIVGTLPISAVCTFGILQLI